MKKTKQNISLVINSKNANKLPVEYKYSSSKKNVKQKKPKDAIHKENRSFIGVQKSCVKCFTPKKPSQNKKKQRSKSLLFQHKNCEMVGEIPTIQNTHRKTLRDHFKVRAEKQQTKQSGCINSIRFEEIRDVDFNLNSCLYSPYKPTHNFVNSELKKSHLCFQEVIDLKFEGEKSTIQKQNNILQIKIAQLQQQMQSMRCDKQFNKKQLLQQFNSERIKLIAQIADLRACKLQFKQQKYDLECIISEQKEQIQKAADDKNAILQELKEEQRCRTELQKNNGLSQLKIQSLEGQLSDFQSNLSQFAKMRDSYEFRLQELQFQKKKIKSHACELLDMLHKYQQHEQD